MKNGEIARIFFEIADLLEIKGVQWKPNAYRKAARNIDSLSEDIEKVYERGGEDGLKEIPGVGEATSAKIVEFLKTGRMKEHEKLKKEIPRGVEEMMNVTGLGPRKAYRLYNELKVKSLSGLRKAAESGRVRSLGGFGEKSEKDILRGLQIYKESQDRKTLGMALPLAREIVSRLERLKEVERVDIAGSLSRRKETIGDIDILAISDKPSTVMSQFTGMSNVKEILASGGTKSSVLLKEGMQCDLRVLPEKSYGSALNYFIGSKEHNVKLRTVAIRKGMKLSEYGLFSRSGKFLAGRNEGEIYRKLGMQYIPPEMRENRGEIELAQKGVLPSLIPYGSARGDLHTHTTWTDGQNTTEQMIMKAQEIGYSYIGVTDHSKSTYVANGLDDNRLVKRLAEIESLKKKHEIRVFGGAETDINKDGSLDFVYDLLKRMDIVLVSIHSRFKSTREEMTSRIVKALENPYVNVLCHPSGRLMGRRNAYDADFGKVFQAAKDNSVALEINASPSRLDLNDIHIAQAREIGCKFSINTDAHSVEQFRYMEFGIAQARRGWLEAKDVINTWPLSKLEKFLGK